MKTSKTPRLEGVTIKTSKTSVKKKTMTPRPGQLVRWKGYDGKFHAARITRVYSINNPTGKTADVAVKLVDPLSGVGREVLLTYVKFSKDGKKGYWSWKLKK
jgi:hypothetical protein